MTDLVLVTGASGAIGTGVLRRLRADGVRTRALVHRAPTVEADERVEGDLRSGRDLEAALDGVSVVIHAAAVSHARDPRAYVATNVDGTRHLVRVAETKGVARLVHVSTRAIDERGGAYSRSKAEAERIVREGSVPSTIVRLPEVYGVGLAEAGGSTTERALDRIRETACAGRAVAVVGRGDQVICPVHLDEAVAAIAAARTAPRAVGRTYTLAGHCLTVAEYARLWPTPSGRPVRLLHVPTGVVRLASILARVAPVGLYPDQLARLLAPKPPPSPEAEADLGFDPAPIRP